MLWMYQRVFYGKVPGAPQHEEDHGHGAHGHEGEEPHEETHDVGHAHGLRMPDLSPREWGIVIPLVVMMVWMGVYSQSFLPPVGKTNAKILEQTHVNVTVRVQAKPMREVANAR